MQTEDVSSAVSIQATAEILSHLEAGQRAWFWISFGVFPNAPALLVQPLNADPDQQTLQAQRAKNRTVRGSVEDAGVLMADEDGTLNFLGRTLSAATFDALVAWTLEHHEEHPGLARLRGARFHRINAEGQITQTHATNDWGAVPELPTPGTIAEAAAYLETMQPGQQAWFWLSASGPDGRPLLMVVPVVNDPNGAAFQERARRLRLRGESVGEVISGVMRMNDEHRLLLTTRGENRWRQAISQLLSAHIEVYPSLLRFVGVRLIRLTDGKPAAPEQLEPWMEFALQTLLLQTLHNTTARLLFWFTNAARNKKPLLLLDTDPQRLKARAQASVGSGHSSRGQVRLSKKGRLTFGTKHPHPEFLPHLAKMVTAKHKRWPAFLRLRDAQFVVLQKDGTKQAKKDPELWKDLPNLED